MIRYRVTMWEMERGWGQRHFMDKDFETQEEAERYQLETNAKNTDVMVPSWYILADAPVMVDALKNPPRG